MGSQTEQEEEEMQAVPGKNWREILLYLYENEIVIDVYGPEGRIPSNADVVEDTGLDPERVVTELQYLADEELVEYTHIEVDDGSETFVAYRLTAEGFKIAQERAEAARNREQTDTQIGINRQLTYATLILAVTGTIQATASVLGVGAPYKGVLLDLFFFLLLTLLAMMVEDLWGEKIWATFRQLRQS